MVANPELVVSDRDPPREFKITAGDLPAEIGLERHPPGPVLPALFEDYPDLPASLRVKLL